MKKHVYIFIVMLALKGPVFSQADFGDRPNIQNLKIGFVTRQLALTSEEAEKFWPLYNKYTNELKKARQEQKEDVLAFEERALNIRKQYKGEFKKILVTDDRLNKALTIDRDFNNVLKKELQRRAEIRNKRKEFNKKALQ